MCGITGGVSLLSGFDFQPEVERMNDYIAHRGPDGKGIYIDDMHRVCFGHRRLAILDLSDLGHQPFKINDYVITYNGEVYNYLELRVELEAIGVKFFSQSDTEVILQAYIQWGDSCVNKFNGMWAFAIYNKDKNKVFCSRDRFGIKPFYYTIHRSHIYFASEIKAFLALDGWESKLNLSRANDFLTHSLISHTSETLLEGVLELRGGYNLNINLENGTYEIQQYYRYDSIHQNHKGVTEKDQLIHFEFLLRDAVRISLRSDVKVGSALSGGIDSSTIVSIISEQFRVKGQEDKQECVSAVYTDLDKNIDESFFVNILAEEKQVKVHKIQPNWQHLMDNLDKMVWHQDEPIPTLSIYAQFAVFEEASNKGLIVMLDGQGADEILGGYESFYEGYFKELLRSSPFLILPSLIGYLISHKKIPFEMLFKKIFSKASQQNWFSESFSNQVKNYSRNDKKSVRGMSEDYLENFGLHSLLKFEDRNSMAFSVESRVPFLDFRVVEYALSLPTNLKIKKGIRKYILREAFKQILPKSIYSRFDKLGFPSPQERWSIENYKDITKMLNDAIKRSPQIFNLESFRDAENLIKCGDKNFIYLAWRVILFDKWSKLFKVKSNL
jgi:asparagine synthase (glutamine-hydrolysing)